MKYTVQKLFDKVPFQNAHSYMHLEDSFESVYGHRSGWRSAIDGGGCNTKLDELAWIILSKKKAHLAFCIDRNARRKHVDI